MALAYKTASGWTSQGLVHIPFSFKNEGPQNEDSGSWFKANKMRLIFTARYPTGVTN